MRWVGRGDRAPTPNWAGQDAPPTEVGLAEGLCSVGGLRALVGRGGVALWGFGLVHFS